MSLQEGEVDCWPLVCPVLMCEYTAAAEGECCPHCVTDPCLADNLSYDIRQTCQDPAGVVRLSGDTWHMPNSPCTTCKCKVGQQNKNHNKGLLYHAATLFYLKLVWLKQKMFLPSTYKWYMVSMTVFDLQFAFRSFVVYPSLQLHHFMCNVMQPPKFEFMFMISVLKENSGLVSSSDVCQICNIVF